MMLMPRSLFGRTALLIAVTIAVFAVISWQAIIWTALVPSAEAAASLLTERAHAALSAIHAVKAAGGTPHYFSVNLAQCLHET